MTKTLLRTLCAPALLVALYSNPVWSAPPPSNAMVVEEEWKLVLDTPNTTGDSPQFCTSFSLGNGDYIVTTWNYRTYPDYVEGGIQLQVWEDGEVVDVTTVDLAELNVKDDTITWKHVYRVQASDVDMKIVGVNSQTWGNNINTSSVSKPNANVANFNLYDPAASCRESGITLGANRVEWFGITGVTVYDEKGRRMVTDSTLRPVYTAPSSP